MDLLNCEAMNSIVALPPDTVPSPPPSSPEKNIRYPSGSTYQLESLYTQRLMEKLGGRVLAQDDSAAGIVVPCDAAILRTRWFDGRDFELWKRGLGGGGCYCVYEKRSDQRESHRRAYFSDYQPPRHTVQARSSPFPRQCAAWC